MNTPPDDFGNSAPIEEEYRESMNLTALILEKQFAPNGFILLVFEFGEGGRRMNYISNAQRADVVTAMKEFISNAESGEWE